MAFQSHVFEDGQWVTRTNNLNDIINRSAATKPAREIQHAPQCGILTRTVVQSPLAHWILSVRLRSSKHNDVAFVGVSTSTCRGASTLVGHQLTFHRTTMCRFQS